MVRLIHGELKRLCILRPKPEMVILEAKISLIILSVWNIGRYSVQDDMMEMDARMRQYFAFYIDLVYFTLSGGTTISSLVTGDVTVVRITMERKSSIAIYRPSAGEWWLQRSSLGAIAFQFGSSTDKRFSGFHRRRKAI